MYFISHRFSILCLFFSFLSPTPSLPLSFFFPLPPKNFHLSSTTKILTQFLLIKKKENKKRIGVKSMIVKKKKKRTRRDCVFHQSELCENVHKQTKTQKNRYCQSSEDENRGQKRNQYVHVVVCLCARKAKRKRSASLDASRDLPPRLGKATFDPYSSIHGLRQMLYVALACVLLPLYVTKVKIQGY